mgnify:FL=1
MNERVYIEELKEEAKTSSGIIIQGDIGRDSRRAKVIAVASDVEGLAAGEVVFPIWSLCQEVGKVDGKKRYMVRSEDILGVDEGYQAS